MFKATFDNLVASPSLWRALGALEAYAYTNGHGPVRWPHSALAEAYALELLTRARAEMPPESTDEAIVAHAVVIRGRDRSAQALQELGHGLSRLADRGVRVTAALATEIEYVVLQLTRGVAA